MSNNSIRFFDTKNQFSIVFELLSFCNLFLVFKLHKIVFGMKFWSIHSHMYEIYFSINLITRTSIHSPALDNDSRILTEMFRDAL